MKKIMFAAIICTLISGNAFADYKARIVEESSKLGDKMVRIQIPVANAVEEAQANVAIKNAWSAVSGDNKLSVGAAIDKITDTLKIGGVKNAFVNTLEEMRATGKMTDSQMWKAWIPHPTDNKKVFAILRLKDNAIATVRKGNMSASVVADTAADAEEKATTLLSKGEEGLKIADAQGMDALLLINEGKKYRTGMAGGFKKQYGEASK